MKHIDDPKYCAYLDQYKLLHKHPNIFPGESIDLNLKFISPLIESTQSHSLLDYGCGKGFQYTKRNLHKTHLYGIMPTLYDPAVVEHSTYPEGQFDGVICTDVLEHIPESSVGFVLSSISEKAKKFVFLSISTIPAITKLPNGENAHTTIKPVEWWIDKVLLHSARNVLWNIVFRGHKNAKVGTANVLVCDGHVLNFLDGRLN